MQIDREREREWQGEFRRCQLLRMTTQRRDWIPAYLKENRALVERRKFEYLVQYKNIFGNMYWCNAVEGDSTAALR
jgi:hypothetical protein